MQSWSSSYHEATVALQGREEAVAAQAEAIETNLTLLGATAVEDRLQEGVPEAISTLSAAGIKVFVSTAPITVIHVIVKQVHTRQQGVGMPHPPLVITSVIMQLQ